MEQCSFRSSSFKTLMKHCERNHSYFVHPAQICHDCCLIMDSACEILQHFRKHITQGLNSFSYTPDKALCPPCKLHWTFFNQIVHYQDEWIKCVLQFSCSFHSLTITPSRGQQVLNNLLVYLEVSNHYCRGLDQESFFEGKVHFFLALKATKFHLYWYGFSWHPQ